MNERNEEVDTQDLLERLRDADPHEHGDNFELLKEVRDVLESLLKERDLDEVREAADDLEEYLRYENDERQEALVAACDLVNYPDYISDELWNLACKEVIEALQWYRENMEVVRVPHTTYVETLAFKKDS